MPRLWHAFSIKHSLSILLSPKIWAKPTPPARASNYLQFQACPKIYAYIGVFRYCSGQRPAQLGRKAKSLCFSSATPLCSLNPRGPRRRKMPVRRLERKQRYCGPSIAEPAGSAGSVSSAGSTGSAGPQRTPRARRARQIHPADPAGPASRPTGSAARSSAARMCVVRLRACALSPCERCGARAQGRRIMAKQISFIHVR